MHRRTQRGALVGSSLTVLTVAGHTAGQGSIDPLGLLITSVLAIALGLAVTGRPLGFVRLLTVLLAGQALLHVVLTFASGHAHAHTAGPSATLMAAGHALAALAAAALVWHADDLIDRWAALLTASLGRDPIAALRPEPATSPMVSTSAPARLRLRHLDHGVERRGPPVSRPLTPV